MITVAIADDHDIVREGIKAITSNDPGILIIAEAGSYREVKEMFRSVQPDILLLDIFMDSRDTGFRILEEIPFRQNGTRVLVISMFCSPDIVKKAFDLGASGFLPKSEASRLLLEAIHTLDEGRMYLTADLTPQTPYFNPAETLTPSRIEALLTNREMSVFRHLGTGLSVRAIAEVLDITSSTVGSHVENIKSKLEFSSIGDLTLYAVKWNMRFCGSSR